MDIVLKKIIRIKAKKHLYKDSIVVNTDPIFYNHHIYRNKARLYQAIQC